jgi:post-segregation antitoxin (ccd killing protein)
MPTKGNVVLYLDKELVEKIKDLGFNLRPHMRKSLKTIDISENKL